VGLTAGARNLKEIVILLSDRSMQVPPLLQRRAAPCS
jgi:hypothetical protein